tara:strand:- start:4291 stop:4944 length:654 start_codon:yes stop_codon:yes gene_type:complete
MSWVSVGISGASAITSGVIAAKQKKAAKGIKVGKETVSDEEKKALEMQKAKAAQGFAGKAQALELGGAARANALGQAGAGGRNAMLGEAMKQGSTEALKLSALDAESKEANQASYLSGLRGMGDKKEAIQRSEIDKASAAKAALLASSQQNVSNAMSAAAGAASTVASRKAKAGTDASTTTSGGAVSDAGLKTAAEVSVMTPEQQAAYKSKYGEKYK